MKKILFLITLLYAMFFTSTAFAIEGEGTEESPFLITTQEELLLINDFPDSHFKLMNNIILEGEWIPLCTSSENFTGTLDGNGYTISNLTITANYKKVGLFAQSDGNIKNLNVDTSETGITMNYSFYNGYISIMTGINNGIIDNCKITGIVNYTNKYETSDYKSFDIYIGSICGQNNGTISNSKANCSLKGTMFKHETNYLGKEYYGAKCYMGGISGMNTALIITSSSTGKFTISSAYCAYIGGITGKLDGGNIENSYANSIISASAYSTYSYTGGIASGTSQNNSTIQNCYSVGTQNSNNRYGIASCIVTNSFYDTTVSGLSDAGYGTPKSTLAMKMKKTYSDAGWDFDNVWGISSDINNGYPYLLWEYVDNSSANTEIIGVTSTDNSLKFISEVQIEGKPEISTFGTAFIPLWLFETGSTDTATVSYDNSKYNIQSGQTFGATLTGIPESCKNMEIVGKSFIKDTDGNYTWSMAKYSSVDDTILNSLE